MIGGDYRTWNASEKIKKYWNDKYRIEGLIALRDLLDQTMTKEVWQKNKTPYFIGYYFENESKKDNIISIEAVRRYSEVANTPDHQSKVIPFSQGRGHVISSQMMNPQWSIVQDSIFSFAENVLEMSQASKLASVNPEQ